MKTAGIIIVAAATGSHAFTAPQCSTAHQSMAIYSTNNDAEVPSRRQFLAVSTAAAGVFILSNPSASYASGGATAGKYTTIPIAKRRYYGRVQEAVHEFLLMAPAVIKGDMTDPTIQVTLVAACWI
jgi:hypothetical protein